MEVVPVVMPEGKNRGERPLLLNLDETAVPLEYTHTSGNIIVREGRRRIKNMQPQSRKASTSTAFPAAGNSHEWSARSLNQRMSLSPPLLQIKCNQAMCPHAESSFARSSLFGLPQVHTRRTAAERTSCRCTKRGPAGLMSTSLPDGSFDPQL